MKHRVTLIFLAYFFGLFLLSWTASAKAQVTDTNALYKSVIALDNQLFEHGFNQCKLDAVATIADDKLEFFHDKSGMQNRAEFLAALKKNVCGNPEGKPVRTLVASSTKIFPLENNGIVYGAVQHGVHRFHLKGTDLSKAGYTVAKFTHVWLLKDGKWTLKNAISYDHQQKFENVASNTPSKKPVAKPYTIFSFNIAPYSLRLEQQAVN